MSFLKSTPWSPHAFAYVFVLHFPLGSLISHNNFLKGLLLSDYFLAQNSLNSSLLHLGSSPNSSIWHVKSLNMPIQSIFSPLLPGLTCTPTPNAHSTHLRLLSDPKNATFSLDKKPLILWYQVCSVPVLFLSTQPIPQKKSLISSF